MNKNEQKTTIMSNEKKDETDIGISNQLLQIIRECDSVYAVAVKSFHLGKKTK